VRFSWKQPKDWRCYILNTLYRNRRQLSWRDVVQGTTPGRRRRGCHSWITLKRGLNCAATGEGNTSGSWFTQLEKTGSWCSQSSDRGWLKRRRRRKKNKKYSKNKLCGRPPQYTPVPASWPLTFLLAESRVAWATSVPTLVFLGLSVLDVA